MCAYINIAMCSTVYPSGAPEIALGFWCASCCSVLLFYVVFCIDCGCLLVVVVFYSRHCQYVFEFFVCNWQSFFVSSAIFVVVKVHSTFVQTLCQLIMPKRDECLYLLTGLVLTVRRNNIIFLAVTPLQDYYEGELSKACSPLKFYYWYNRVTELNRW